MKRKFRKKAKAVSASELAQMGVCERLVVFEHRYGKRHTAARRAAIRYGLQAHDRFFRDGVRMTEKRGRCYLSTLTFGAGPETVVLRRFRDRILRSNATGRWLILVYYKTAPAVCTVLTRWPWLQPLVRTLLRPMVWLAGCVLPDEEGGHVD